MDTLEDGIERVVDGVFEVTDVEDVGGEIVVAEN
jgi:hypothetical protein